MQKLDTDEADSPESRLYARFATIIYTYLLQQVASPQDAEDLLLEVFLVAIQESTLVDLPAKRQLAWLRRAARNKVIDRYRHAMLLTLLPLEEFVEAVDPALTPEEQAEQRESYQCLSQTLARLSLDQQTLIRLRYGHGLRFAEIAALLDRPEGTVRKQLLRALRRVRKLYDRLERSIEG